MSFIRTKLTPTKTVVCYLLLNVTRAYQRLVGLFYLYFDDLDVGILIVIKQSRRGVVGHTVWRHRWTLVCDFARNRVMRIQQSFKLVPRSITKLLQLSASKVQILSPRNSKTLKWIHVGKIL